MRIPVVTILGVCALALTGCFNDSSMQPGSGTAGDRPATTTDDDIWQTAIDELVAMEGAEALMAEMAPLLEKVRSTQGPPASFWGDDILLFLAFETTTFVVVPPFPPPVLTIEITFTGISTIGSYTGFSLSSVDVTVEPNIQTGVQTDTHANGDELSAAYEGTAVPGEGPGDVKFEGSSTVIGGTGRYSGATGSIHYAGRANQIEATGMVLRWGYVVLDDDDDDEDS